jgi:PIN domain nuclease of toxin-antitoxin system
VSALVLDTHAVIWFLADSPLLSKPAMTAIESSLAAGFPVHVSSISLAEIIYLEEKGRVLSGTFDKIIGELSRLDGGLIEAPFYSAIASIMNRVPRDIVPDFPDRIITATALHLGLPLVTADRQIRASGIPTVW